jgi:hypothetical protein
LEKGWKVGYFVSPRPKIAAPETFARACHCQPHVHLHGLVAAEPFEFPFLQNAQKFGLQIETDVSNLVQKQAALLSQFDPAALLRQSAGKSSLFVSEKLAFQQSGRNGCTVQPHKCSVTAGILIVDGARHWPLALSKRLARRDHHAHG